MNIDNDIENDPEEIWRPWNHRESCQCKLCTVNPKDPAPGFEPTVKILSWVFGSLAGLCVLADIVYHALRRF